MYNVATQETSCTEDCGGMSYKKLGHVEGSQALAEPPSADLAALDYDSLQLSDA